MPKIQNSSQNQQQQQPYINLKVVTWVKNSHGLFDYESASTKKNNIKINSSGLLQRKENNAIFIKQGINCSQQEQVVLQIDLIDKMFFLKQNYQQGENNNINGSPNGLEENNQIAKEPCWAVVKSIQKHQKYGFLIRENDIIKMGRVQLKVKEVCFNNIDKKKANSIDFQTDIQTETDLCGGYGSGDKVKWDTESKQGIVCRICLSDIQEIGNPLVNPCKCTGTMKYLHIDCLKLWIQSKMNMPQKDVCQVFLNKNFECEICKTKYPMKFTSDGNTYDLVELSKPNNQPYAIFEILGPHRENVQGYYLLMLTPKQNYGIGRSHDCDLRISDISVSRLHALLYFDETGLYIQDKNSKFGTLVLLRDDLPLTADLNGMQIQSGRTVVELSFKNNNLNNCSLFNLCLDNSTESEEQAAIQNNQGIEEEDAQLQVQQQQQSAANNVISQNIDQDQMQEEYNMNGDIIFNLNENDQNIEVNNNNNIINQHMMN